MLRRAAVIVLGTVLALLLGSCTAGPAPGTGPGSAPSGVPSAAPSPDAAPLRVGALRGPTFMGLAPLAADPAAGDRYAITVAGSPDELTPRIVRGDLDVALLPANLGAVLAARTNDQVKVIGVNTLGVLKVMTNATPIASLKDLKHKTVHTTGKGASPEYVLRDLLRAAGLDPDRDVTLRFHAEATEVAAALAADPTAVGVLPEPFATILPTKSPGWTPALDLTTEWRRVHPDSELVQGVTIVRTQVWQTNPDAVRAFLRDHAASVDRLNQHPADTAPLLVQAGLLPDAATAERAIPASHVMHLTGADARAALLGYLRVLYAAAPESVGGRPPDDSLVVDP